MAKNADPDKYIYSGYGIGLDSRSEVSLYHYFQNIIICEVDMSSSVHIDNKDKDILTLGDGTTQGLDNTTLTAEDKYSIDFSR